MNELRLDKHDIHPDHRTVVEIHHPTLGLIGVIYPTGTGVRIVSKYLNPRKDIVAVDPTEPPALEIFIP